MKTVTHQDRVAVRSRAQQGLIENADVDRGSGQYDIMIETFESTRRQAGVATKRVIGLTAERSEEVVEDRDRCGRQRFVQYAGHGG